MHEITLKPQVLWTYHNLIITNTIFSSIIVILSIGILFYALSKKFVIYKPGKLQIAFEQIYTMMGDIYENITGNTYISNSIFSLVFSFFIYILISNWFGLLPFVGNVGFQNHGSGEHLISLFRAPTSDLSITLGLAILSVAVANIIGFLKLGFKFFEKYINFSNPINFIVGILEMISEFGKIISFSFRLFGNIFAGEVLLVVITYISYGIASLPFYGLEIFVGFIQAFVFFMLTTVFINLAASSH